MWNPVGEYCVHGFEAFPGWHRACVSPARPRLPHAIALSLPRICLRTDLLEFERVMRRADMALGGDGSIGLPYWGWDEVTVNDETFPKILRERFEECKSHVSIPLNTSRTDKELTIAVGLVADPDDMFPEDIGGSAAKQGDRGLRIRGDRQLAWRLRKQGRLAQKTLDSEQHWQHACTRGRSANKPSLESPHNSIHGAVGGVMATFQSSFHPVFWLQCASPFAFPGR